MPVAYADWRKRGGPAAARRRAESDATENTAQAARARAAAALQDAREALALVERSAGQTADAQRAVRLAQDAVAAAEASRAASGKASADVLEAVRTAEAAVARAVRTQALLTSLEARTGAVAGRLDTLLAAVAAAKDRSEYAAGKALRAMQEVSRLGVAVVDIEPAASQDGIELLLSNGERKLVKIPTKGRSWFPAVWTNSDGPGSGGSGGGTSIVTQSVTNNVSVTLVPGVTVILADATAADVTVTLPACAAAMAAGAVANVVRVDDTAGHTVTVVSSSRIRGATDAVITRQHTSLYLIPTSSVAYGWAF